MKLPLLLLLAALALGSCKKADVESVSPASISNMGYILVSCGNCKIDYGMPDQYKTFNVAGGTSSKAPYTYAAGYTLQVNITALDHDQKIALGVYDTKGKIVYTSTTTQSTTGYWGTATLLPLQ